MSVDRKMKISPVKSYDIPEISYVAQGKKGKKNSVISLGKIMSAYGAYLKELENFSASNKDYAVTMAIGFLRIKRFKSYLKKCYNRYKLNKEKFEEVKKIANDFRGAAAGGDNGSFANFYQAIMRIKSPLEEIEKELKKDKNLLKNILSGLYNGSNRSKIIGAQNEFFKFADKTKISKEFDKDFFMNFENLYALSLKIPAVVNKSIGELYNDLNSVCSGAFKLSLKKVVAEKIKDKLEGSTEKTFVRMFVNKIEGFENSIERILKQYKFNKYNLKGKELNDFNLDKPQVFYKKLTDFEKCEKFLKSRKGSKNGLGRMNEYFESIREYVNEFPGVEKQNKDRVLGLVDEVEKSYKQFSKETGEALKDSKKLKEWIKKNK